MVVEGKGWVAAPALPQSAEQLDSPLSAEQLLDSCRSAEQLSSPLRRPTRPLTLPKTLHHHHHHQVLFFPDPGMPCRQGSNCRRNGCTYAHQQTSLVTLLNVLGSARSTLGEEAVGGAGLCGVESPVRLNPRG